MAKPKNAKQKKQTNKTTQQNPSQSQFKTSVSYHYGQNIYFSKALTIYLLSGSNFKRRKRNRDRNLTG